MRTASLAFCAFVASSSFAAPTVELVRPENAPGMFASPAFVNDRGDIAFHYSFAPNVWPQHSFIRWADGELEEITLAPPPGHIEGDYLPMPTVWGIDDSGVALVLQDATINSETRRFVHRYERGGTTTVAADFYGSWLGNAAIGSAGHLALSRAESSGTDTPGLVFLRPDNSIFEIGRPDDATLVPLAMNASGQAAVTFDPAGALQFAARVDIDGAITTLDQFDRAFGAGINDHGTIVGSAAESSADVHAYSAFLWREGASTAEILDRPDGAYSVGAIAINNLDWVVGNLELDDGGQQRAVLWIPGENMIDLTAYFADQLNGAVLYSAYDISDTGWIVGEAIDTDGWISVFVAQIPAPASSFALGGLALLASRRRR